HGQAVKGFGAFQAHFYGAVIGRVADGVAHDVFNGTAQQLRIAFQFGFTKIEGERDAMTLGLDMSIVHDDADQFVEADRFRSQTVGVAFSAGDLNQFSDKHIQAVGFAFNAIEGDIGVASAARQFNGNAETGKRGAEFVRNVLEKTALGFEKAFNAFGHLIDGAAELPELVGAAGVDAGGEIAFAEALDGFLHPAEGGSQLAGQ